MMVGVLRVMTSSWVAWRYCSAPAIVPPPEFRGVAPRGCRKVRTGARRRRHRPPRTGRRSDVLVDAGEQRERRDHGGLLVGHLGEAAIDVEPLGVDPRQVDEEPLVARL